MSTLKAQAARANGAKSRGPKTPAGKQRSSQNALKHGLTARTLVLDNESGENFDQLSQEYLDQFQPVGRLETDLVQQMVSALWRQRRLWGIETALLDIEMDRREAEVDENFVNCDPEARRAIAFKELAEGGAMGLINRYETRLRRMFDRALRLLNEAQTARKQNLQNEPKLAGDNDGPATSEPSANGEPPNELPPLNNPHNGNNTQNGDCLQNPPLGFRKQSPPCPDASPAPAVPLP
jgi:hypothetical protein